MDTNSIELNMYCGITIMNPQNIHVCTYLHVPSCQQQAQKQLTNKQQKKNNKKPQKGYKIHKTQLQRAQQILKQPPWLRYNKSPTMAQKISSHNGLENKQSQWLRKFEVKMEHWMPSLVNWEWQVNDL